MLGQWASPSCSCCSRATCLTISWSVSQSYSANTCHLGPITHSILFATAVLHQPEFHSDIRILASPLQAAPHKFKFRVSSGSVFLTYEGGVT